MESIKSFLGNPYYLMTAVLAIAAFGFAATAGISLIQERKQKKEETQEEPLEKKLGVDTKKLKNVLNVPDLKRKKNIPVIEEEKTENAPEELPNDKEEVPVSNIDTEPEVLNPADVAEFKSRMIEHFRRKDTLQQSLLELQELMKMVRFWKGLKRHLRTASAAVTGILRQPLTFYLRAWMQKPCGMIYCGWKFCDTGGCLPSRKYNWQSGIRRANMNQIKIQGVLHLRPTIFYEKDRRGDQFQHAGTSWPCSDRKVLIPITCTVSPLENGQMITFQRIKKGTTVFVQGHLHTEEGRDANNQKVYFVTVTVDYQQIIEKTRI